MPESLGTTGARWELRLESPADPGLVLRIAREGDEWFGTLSADGVPRSPSPDVRTSETEELLEHLARRLTRAAGLPLRWVVDAGLPIGDAPWRAALEDLGRAAVLALESARHERCLADSSTARALLAPDAAAIAELRSELARPLEVCRKRLGPLASRIGQERFGGRVALFAPLYLSDACQNDCSYCGFRKSHPRRRVHLEVDEATLEARAIADMGLRSIDIVTGEVPHDPFVDRIARAVEAILRDTPIQRVHLNVGALSQGQYRSLRAAGAAGIHLYQETYDPAVYGTVHCSGPKRDLAWRLEAPERAIEAGFSYIGLGLLLGLAEPAAELAALLRHGRTLVEAHPSIRLGFSLPRFCAADPECAFEAHHPIDDALFEKCLLVLRTRFPSAEMTLTTRERPALRDALLPLGITKLSAGVSTAPGGYARTAAGSEQFHIGDVRSPAEVAAAVQRAGLQPVF